MKSLNQKNKKKFYNFQYASDNCQSYKDHVECKRIMSLIRIRSKNRNAQSIKFIKENLLKSFNVLKKDLLIQFPKRIQKKMTLIN